MICNEIAMVLPWYTMVWQWCQLLAMVKPWSTMVFSLQDHGIPWSGNGANYRPWSIMVGNEIIAYSSQGTDLNMAASLHLVVFQRSDDYCQQHNHFIVDHRLTIVYHGQQWNHCIQLIGVSRPGFWGEDTEERKYIDLWQVFSNLCFHVHTKFVFAS